MIIKIKANKMLIQRVKVNGSSINKAEDLKPVAGVMNVIGENKYISEK